MFAFHKDKDRYFNIQYEHARQYVIPFIEQTGPVKAGSTVLEIGCAEGGVLKAFLDRGLTGVGVELSASRAEQAKTFLKDQLASGAATIHGKDIYDPQFLSAFRKAFDLIVLKDVIEHIHDQEKLLLQLREYLKPEGRLFFGFPPWHMPFGGHQQVCRNKIASLLPYYHLLPVPAYRGLLNLFGENSLTISDLMEVKETGISTYRFEKLLKRTGMKSLRRRIYFINPIYSYKFRMTPLKQPGVISAIPFFRDVVSTAAFYVVGKAG